MLGQQGTVVELEEKHGPVQQSKRIPATHQVVGVEAGAVLTLLLDGLDELCDMLIVPAKEEGFKKVFLGEKRWRAVRISRKYLSQVRYICAYQTTPISAVTYWAEVEKIEPYGDKGKYQLFFKGKVQKMENPLKYENLPQGFMQGIRYTNFDIFQKAKTLKELFFWKKW